jgi:hypothetical protein
MGACRHPGRANCGDTKYEPNVKETGGGRNSQSRSFKENRTLQRSRVGKWKVSLGRTTSTVTVLYCTVSPSLNSSSIFRTSPPSLMLRIDASGCMKGSMPPWTIRASTRVDRKRGKEGGESSRKSEADIELAQEPWPHPLVLAGRAELLSIRGGFRGDRRL